MVVGIVSVAEALTLITENEEDLIIMIECFHSYFEKFESECSKV